MKHRIDVFSPETFQWFSSSDRQLAGVKARYRTLASEVAPGDLLIGYVTRLSRWCGVLEVAGRAFEDSALRFSDSDDPYILRFRVKPLVWLPIDQSIPVHEDFVWNALSFTQNHAKTSSLWTGPLRTSLTAMTPGDGAFLVTALRQQAESPRRFPLDSRAQRVVHGYRVNRADGAVSVTVPDDLEDDTNASETPGTDVRESIKIQSLLVRIGAAMRMRIWIPANDRAAVVRELGNDDTALLDNLPLNYDSTTIDTIERIDVLWVKGRSIVRAFEVEHTTSIYSGLLRMGDLLSLQPNMDIRLHIVAPDERRTKVMNEIRRPIFSLIERRPLAKTCSFLSYDAVRELNDLPHLEHTSDSILQEFEEFADE
jgi:hypothetical protein